MRLYDITQIKYAVPTSTRMSPEWWNSKCCKVEKIRRHYILRVSRVFSLLFSHISCIYFATFITGWNSTLDVLSDYALSLVSLNPLIYCWKMRHIRHAVVDILWKRVPSHNLEKLWTVQAKWWTNWDCFGYVLHIFTLPRLIVFWFSWVWKSPC